MSWLYVINVDKATWSHSCIYGSTVCLLLQLCDFGGGLFGSSSALKQHNLHWPVMDAVSSTGQPTAEVSNVFAVRYTLKASRSL